ncbi:MAG: translation initiation factor IF-3 [Patescibacteria group bacterium]|nr:translation initiation factor IF-3 [Patescibacteria group bacterium]
MRISRRKRKPQYQRVIYPVNERIREPELRVITDDGEHLGTLKTPDALRIAKERELDLVVIQPKAKPPVAKIIDFGKYKYEKEKEARQQKSKSKTVEVKGVRLSVRIGQHDMDVRKEQAKKFMDKGDKVKVEIILRGREKRHGEVAIQVIKRFIDELNEDMPIKIEQPVTRQGGQLTSIVAKA